MNPHRQNRILLSLLFALFVGGALGVHKVIAQWMGWI